MIIWCKALVQLSTYTIFSLKTDICDGPHMRGCGLIVIGCELETLLDAQHVLHTLDHAWKGLNSKHQVSQWNKYLKKSRHALVIVLLNISLHLATCMLADNGKHKWWSGCSLLVAFYEGQVFRRMKHTYSPCSLGSSGDREVFYITLPHWNTLKIKFSFTVQSSLN